MEDASVSKNAEEQTTILNIHNITDEKLDDVLSSFMNLKPIEVRQDFTHDELKSAYLDSYGNCYRFLRHFFSLNKLCSIFDRRFEYFNFKHDELPEWRTSKDKAELKRIKLNKAGEDKLTKSNPHFKHNLYRLISTKLEVPVHLIDKDSYLEVLSSFSIYQLTTIFNDFSLYLKSDYKIIVNLLKNENRAHSFDVDTALENIAREVMLKVKKNYEVTPIQIELDLKNKDIAASIPEYKEYQTGIQANLFYDPCSSDQNLSEKTKIEVKNMLIKNRWLNTCFFMNIIILIIIGLYF